MISKATINPEGGQSAPVSSTLAAGHALPEAPSTSFSIFIPTSPRERAEWDMKIRRGRFIQCQAEWVADKSRLKFGEKCRQLGFSWTDSFDSLL